MIYNSVKFESKINEIASKKPGGAQMVAPGKPKPVAAQFTALFEEAKPYLDRGEEVPDLLMAQFVKIRLLQQKITDKENEQLRLVFVFLCCCCCCFQMLLR